jgi:hypothetical protein
VAQPIHYPPPPPPQQVGYHYGPPPGVGYAPPHEVGQSYQGMGIAGFVMSLIFIVSPIGLIFSIVALNGMKRTGNEQGKGLAIAGLVIGIVFTIIWVIYFLVVVTCFGSMLR